MFKVKSFVIGVIATALLVILVGSAFAVNNSKTDIRDFIDRMENRHESVFGKGSFEKMKKQMESMMGKGSFEKMTKSMKESGGCGSNKDGKNNEGMMQGNDGGMMQGADDMMQGNDNMMGSGTSSGSMMSI